jgi:hypothetical protein
MSVIAFDGKIIAADKRAVIDQTPHTTTKLTCARVRSSLTDILSASVVCGWTGDYESGLAVKRWLETENEPWPACQSGDAWTRFVVLTTDGRIGYFERLPEIQLRDIEADRFVAFGSGRDFALGAMRGGASAIEAVHIASEYDIYCGNGVDAYTFNKVGGRWFDRVKETWWRSLTRDQEFEP